MGALSNSPDDSPNMHVRPTAVLRTSRHAHLSHERTREHKYTQVEYRGGGGMREVRDRSCDAATALQHVGGVVEESYASYTSSETADRR